MFKKILIATDGSPLSVKAINGAIDYAKVAGSTLVAVTVVEPYPFMPMGEAPAIAAATLAEYSEQAATSNIAEFEKIVKPSGVAYETRIANDLNPWSAIVDAAKAANCDAIFMASHGRKGINALLLGSETQKVLTHTTLPVLVYR